MTTATAPNEDLQLSLPKVGKIKRESQVQEALRLMGELNQRERVAMFRRDSELKRLHEEIAERVEEANDAADRECVALVSGRPVSISKYRADLEEAVKEWAKTEMEGSVFECPYGKVSSREVPAKLDAKGDTQDEREKGRKPLVEAAWKKYAAKAAEWLTSMGLSPWFRVKLELNLSGIADAWKRGEVSDKDAQKHGLYVVPKGVSVSVDVKA